MYISAEFKGKTLQEYLNWKYPTKEDKEGVREITHDKRLEGGELNLSEFKNVEWVSVRGHLLKTMLTKLNFSNLVNLNYLNCANNALTSADFLNQLPNPEKLERLCIYNNNIQPTDIEIFSKFVGLKILMIGNNMEGNLEWFRNRFYGSLKSYQNLTKLESICIEATDVNEGLEYLPESLARETKKSALMNKNEGGYCNIECSPHSTNAKCKAIQDQLRPFNYDIWSWQLAHPEKMLIK